MKSSKKAMLLLTWLSPIFPNAFAQAQSNRLIESKQYIVKPGESLSISNQTLNYSAIISYKEISKIIHDKYPEAALHEIGVRFHE